MNLNQKRLSVIMLVLAIVCSINLSGQANPEKKAFTIDDYARWRSVVSTSISDDGKWMSFGYRRVKADDEFYVKSLTSDKEYEIPRGSRPQFSDDSKWIACIISVPWKEAEKLRKDKKPVPDKAQLMNLVSGKKYTWDNVASFSFSKGSKFLTVKMTKADRKAKHNGTDFILRNLDKGSELSLGNIGNFQFNKPGTLLAYTIDAADKAGNGLYLIDLDTGVLKSMDNSDSDYAHITWDEKGTALAVLKGTKKKEFTQKDNILVAFVGLPGENLAKITYDPAKDPNFPENMIISEKTASRSRFRRGGDTRGPLFWSEDNSQIFCGIKEQEKEPEKKKEDEDPVADVDIWHWKDEVIQSVQMKRASRDRNFTYQSAYNWKSKRFIRLTEEKMRTISIARNGKWGIGRDDKAYISDWKETQADYYRVNTATGERTLMFKGQKRVLGLSPDSKHFLYWKEDHIWDYVIESGKMVNLTESAPVSFANEDYDHPGTKPPYGITGWTKDGKAVILTHKYDLWLQPLKGGAPKNLTRGIGAKEEIRFRYIRTDREERFIDLSKPVLLSAFGQWTKKAGFYTLRKVWLLI
jgi:Tol biopolymer transport system component